MSRPDGAPAKPPERETTGNNYRTRFRAGAFGTVRIRVQVKRDAQWNTIGTHIASSAPKAKAWAQSCIAHDFWAHRG